MKPLVVLLVVFILALFGLKLGWGNYDFAFAGRIAMSAMLLFTAIAHFAFANGMAMMLPDFFPAKKAIVRVTGLIEIAAAVGLLLTGLQELTAWLLILFFIVVLPANIYASLYRIDYQKGTRDGNGAQYLWFRVPLQAFFIVWVYLSCLQP